MSIDGAWRNGECLCHGVGRYAKLYMVGQGEQGMSQQLWDRARWALWIALLGGITYFFAFRSGVEGLPASIWKTTGVGFLALWAWLNARGGQHQHRWIAAILAFGAAGDFLLAEWGLIVGGATFATGHIIAIIFFARNRQRNIAALSRNAVILAVPLALLIAWRLAQGSEAALVGAALSYTLIVALMAASAWLSRFPTSTTGLGAMMFLVSDLFLFAGEGGALSRNISTLLVWPFYFGGQALIAWGVVRTLSREADRG